ncbi:hypothetical protein MKX03_013416 [Papaver bracteatum]|nr:hypothetical protein MKX03_013416 [Papaver bracteatum]
MEEIGSSSMSSSMESKNVRVIGIDLGTTYSRVGFWIFYICVSARSKSRLRFACEDAIKKLSNPNLTETKVSVDSYYVLQSNSTKKKAIPLRVSITPNAFSKECKELFDRCEESVDQCVQISGIFKFHEVILVGGSTRIWRFQEMLREFCSDEKGFCEIVNPDIAVVQGAAIVAAIWSGEALTNPLLKDISIVDVAPEQEESKRKKLEAKMKVWLFVTEHMSQQVLLVLSPSQAEIVKEAIADAQAWLKNNELPEVRASELKLVELQATCYLILRERRGPN